MPGGEAERGKRREDKTLLDPLLILEFLCQNVVLALCCVFSFLYHETEELGRHQENRAEAQLNGNGLYVLRTVPAHRVEGEKTLLR